MSWLRIDDDMLDHEKWRRALREGGDAALLVWLRLTSYCSRRLTDGRVAADMVAEIAQLARSKSRARALQALVEHGLCTRHVDGAIVVCGYLERNPSKADVIAERERRAQAQKNYADRKKLTGQQPVELPPPDPVALPQPDDVPSRPVPIPSPDPIPLRSSAPLEVVRSLRGVEFKHEWRQAALMASVAPDHIDGFWDTLCTGPIGGKRGVLPDEIDRYVLGQIQREWPKWSEQKRAESRVSPLRPVARTRRDEINQTMLRELDELRANEAANEGA